MQCAHAAFITKASIKGKHKLKDAFTAYGSCEEAVQFRAHCVALAMIATTDCRVVET